MGGLGLPHCLILPCTHLAREAMLAVLTTLLLLLTSVSPLILLSTTSSPLSLKSPSDRSFLHTYLINEPTSYTQLAIGTLDLPSTASPHHAADPNLKLHVLTNDLNIDLLYPLSQKTVDVFGAPISLAGNMSKYEEVRRYRVLSA